MNRRVEFYQKCTESLSWFIIIGLIATGFSENTAVSGTDEISTTAPTSLNFAKLLENVKKSIQPECHETVKNKATDSVYEYPANESRNCTYVINVIYKRYVITGISETNSYPHDNEVHDSLLLFKHSSCDDKDLQDSLKSDLRSISKNFGLNVSSISINSSCGKTKFVGFYFTSFILLTFVIIVVSSEVYRNKNNKNADKELSLFKEISEDFSIVRNYERLLNVTLPDEKPCIHLISILSILLIIVEQRHKIEFRLSTSIGVDILFAVSGFLSFYYGFKPMQKEGLLVFVVSVISRWIRMIPTFGLYMLFVIYILPHLSNEVSTHKLQIEANKCEKNFWSNLFCVSSNIDYGRQCASMSWYVNLDVQLTVIGNVLLLIIAKEKRYGLISVVLIFLTCCTIVFIKIINLETSEQIELSDGSLFSRIRPYITGFMTAFSVIVLKRLGFTFTNAQKVSLLAAAFLLKVSIALIFFRLYALFSRSLYILFEVSTILIYYTSGLGFVNKIIEFKPWIPMGRLTYMTLLVGSVIQLVHSANRDGSAIASPFGLILWLLSDVIFTYTIGLFIHLFYEAPFSRLFKRLLRYSLGCFTKPAQESYIINSKSHSLECDRKEFGISNPEKCDNATIIEHENTGFEHDEEYHISS